MPASKKPKRKQLGTCVSGLETKAGENCIVIKNVDFKVTGLNSGFTLSTDQLRKFTEFLAV